LIVLPTIGRIPRHIVSTSGSSGMRSQLRTGAKTEECLSRRHGGTGEEGKGKGGRKEVFSCWLPVEDLPNVRP